MWRGSLSHMLFILLPLALAEEIGWRGYLLPKLIAKFGRFWGIFWVSIVWAAFHFSGDLGSIRAIPRAAYVGCPDRRRDCDRIFLVLVDLAFAFGGTRGITHAAINGLNFRFYCTSLCVWLLADLILFLIWPPFSTQSQSDP